MGSTLVSLRLLRSRPLKVALRADSDVRLSDGNGRNPRRDVIAMAQTPRRGCARLRVSVRATVRRSGGNNFLTPILRPRLPQDSNRGREEEAAHQRGDDEVGPGRRHAPNADGRRHHDNVADRVVARADPNRAHVRVAILVAHEQQQGGEIGDQGESADAAHDFGARQAKNEGLINRRSHDPGGHEAEAYPFQERRGGARSKPCADNSQAETISRRIGEEIQAVGLQGLRPRKLASGRVRNITAFMAITIQRIRL